MRSVNVRNESGSVVLEFVGLGILAQVPLLLVAIGLTSLQHDQLAADAINRDALRSFTLQGRAPEVTAVEIAKDFGVAIERVDIQLDCEDGDCESPGALLRMTTKVGVVVATGFAYK